MKRVIAVFLLLLLAVSLFACTAPTDPGQFSADIPDPAFARSQDRFENFIETEDCYYYLYQGKTYFSSKDDPAFYLLCGKPDCSHGGTDCNAYTGFALGWWQGKLYGVGEYNADYVLFSMDADGSNHSEITKIEQPIGTDGVQGGSYSFLFHNGCLYYSVDATPNAFYSIDLSTGTAMRLFEDLLERGACIVPPYRFDGDCMYLVVRELSGEAALYRCRNYDAERVCDWEFDAPQWNIEGQTVFFYSAEHQAFCEYDLPSDTLTEKCPLAVMGGVAYYDTDRIYFVAWETFGVPSSFKVFDRDYQFLDEMPLSSMQDYLFAAGDKLFFTGMPSCPITYYVPAAAVGTGQMELVKVTDPYALR